jgi:hypothetical protein
MDRCHTMLAHISTNRARVAENNEKPWDVLWRTVEPHLDLMISDFLDGLSDERRAICANWVSRWMGGCDPWTKSLPDIAALIASKSRVQRGDLTNIRTDIASQGLKGGGTDAS